MHSQVRFGKEFEHGVVGMAIAVPTSAVSRIRCFGKIIRPLRHTIGLS